MVENPIVVLRLSADRTGVGVVEPHSLENGFVFWCRVRPFFCCRMAIGECVDAATVVIVGREVSPKTSGERIQNEAAVVDTVRVFVGKNPEVGW